MDNNYLNWIYQQQMQMMGQYGNPWSPAWSYNQNPWGRQDQPHLLMPQGMVPAAVRPPPRPILGLPPRPPAQPAPVAAQLAPHAPDQPEQTVAVPNTPAEPDVPAEPVVATGPGTPALSNPLTQANVPAEPDSTVKEVEMEEEDNADRGGGAGSLLTATTTVAHFEKSGQPSSMEREMQQLRYPFFNTEAGLVGERSAKRAAVEGISLSKRTRTEPAIDPPSKRAGKQSKRAPARSSTGPSVAGSTNTPTTSLPTLPASGSPTVIANFPATTSIPPANPSAPNPSTSAALSAVPSSTPATTETSTEAATELVDRKGDHLSHALKRSLEGMDGSMGNIWREFEVIQGEIRAVYQSTEKFTDQQKRLQDIHDRLAPKLNMGKALQAEIKMWATKKLEG